jgi:hypothetical protein
MNGGAFHPDYLPAPFSKAPFHGDFIQPGFAKEKARFLINFMKGARAEINRLTEGVVFPCAPEGSNAVELNAYQFYAISPFGTFPNQNGVESGNHGFQFHQVSGGIHCAGVGAWTRDLHWKMKIFSYGSFLPVPEVDSRPGVRESQKFQQLRLKDAGPTVLVTIKGGKYRYMKGMKDIRESGGWEKDPACSTDKGQFFGGIVAKGRPYPNGGHLRAKVQEGRECYHDVPHNIIA